MGDDDRMMLEGNDEMEANVTAVDVPILRGGKYIRGLGVRCTSTGWEGTTLLRHLNKWEGMASPSPRFFHWTTPVQNDELWTA